MQLRPRFTGAAGSPLTATILSLRVAIMMPQPVPQKRQTDLSHFQSFSVSSAWANALGGNLHADGAGGADGGRLLDEITTRERHRTPLSALQRGRPVTAIYEEVRRPGYFPDSIWELNHNDNWMKRSFLYSPTYLVCNQLFVKILATLRIKANSSLLQP